MLGDPARLWVADVAANRIVAIDVETGRQEDFEVPTDVLIAPHSLHRDKDGMLWITPLFNSIVARLNPDTGEWKTWKLVTDDGRGAGIHDLSFGYEHELLTDRSGRIWFSDIGNTGVGFFDPADGTTEIWSAPNAKARADDTALYGTASLYGLIMNRDRDEIWYSQLGNGVFGGFDIENEAFIGPFVLPDPNAGPRRITISPDDVMYLALYGTGQLAAFDIGTREMIGIYDLPDTASAPYSATWDPVRRVVWVATSNGDVIYRFDPQTRTFGVLPLPRERAFLRMIDIDPETGVLVSSYANVVEVVNGPRMAFIVDPGDGAYPRSFSPANATAPHPGD
jgi:streptogramin lyase